MMASQIILVGMIQQRGKVDGVRKIQVENLAYTVASIVHQWGQFGSQSV